MLRRQSHCEGNNGHQPTIFGLQTFSPQQMVNVNGPGTCVPSTVHLLHGQQTQMTHQRPVKDRSFASAAAAASRARCDYPIFIHHQPHMTLKASSKCASQASPSLPPASRQQPPGSGCAWSYQEGHFNDCKRSNLGNRGHCVSPAATAGQRYHEGLISLRQGLHHMSHIDELCPGPATQFSERHMDPWNQAGIMRAVNQSKQTVGTSLRNAYKDHAHGPHYAGVQDHARDAKDRLAFAG